MHIACIPHIYHIWISYWFGVILNTSYKLEKLILVNHVHQILKPTTQRERERESRLTHTHTHTQRERDEEVHD